MTPSTPELDEALRHEAALRRLAWLLHLGAADADDAVQHAMTQVALGRRPPSMPLGTFLRTVLRHHAFNLRRLSRRRRGREAAHASNDSAPPVDELVARDQLRRRVADAVLALDEPYRTTVWLRWFEGLDVDDVAARLQVPPNTVRTRLQRAHAQLRQRLDRVYGDHRWGALAVPIGMIGAGVTPPIGLLTVAGVMLALVGLGALLAVYQEPEAAPVLAVERAAAGPAVAAEAAPPKGPPVAPAPVPETADRAPVRSATPVGSGVAGPAVKAPATDRLLVSDADGKPAVALSVWWWSPADRPAWTLRPARSSPAGRGIDEIAGAPEPPPASCWTDQHGCIAIPSPRPAAVTLGLAPQLWFSADLPPSGALVLPRTCEVTARLKGGPRDCTWEATLSAAVRHESGERQSSDGARFDVDTQSGGGSVRQDPRRFRGLPHEVFVGTMLADRWAVFQAIGNGFVIAPEATQRRAPFQYTFAGRARRPGVVVHVFDEKGDLTRRGGVVRLVDGPVAAVRPIIDGKAIFDQREWGNLLAARACLDDGEQVIAPLQVVGGGPHREMMARGQWRAPQRVALPSMSTAAIPIQRVFVLTAQDGWQRAFRSDDPTRDSDVVYGFAEQALWVAGADEAPFALICVVDARGRVAYHRADANSTDAGIWLPHAPAQDVDVDEICRRCGGEQLRCEVALGLPNLDGSRSWRVIWSHDWRAHGDRASPNWKGLTLSRSDPWRLQITDPGQRRLWEQSLAH